MTLARLWSIQPNSQKEGEKEMSDSRTVVKRRSIGTATGKTTHTVPVATIYFTDPEALYAPTWDATAHSVSDPSIECRLTKRPTGWRVEDVTDGEWSIVRNPKHPEGLFPSIPAAVGYWQWEGTAKGCWFAYGE